MLYTYDSFSGIVLMERFLDGQMNKSDFLSKFECEMITEDNITNKVKTKIIDYVIWLTDNIKKIGNKISTVINTIYEKAKKILSPSKLKVLGLMLMLLVLQPVATTTMSYNRVKNNNKVEYVIDDENKIKSSKVCLNVAIAIGNDLKKSFDVGSTEYKTLLESIAILAQIRDRNLSSDLSSEDYKYLLDRTKMTILFLVKESKNAISDAHRTKSDKDDMVINKLSVVGSKISGSFEKIEGYENVRLYTNK